MAGLSTEHEGADKLKQPFLISNLGNGVITSSGLVAITVDLPQTPQGKKWTISSLCAFIIDSLGTDVPSGAFSGFFIVNQSSSPATDTGTTSMGTDYNPDLGSRAGLAIGPDLATQQGISGQNYLPGGIAFVIKQLGLNLVVDSTVKIRFIFVSPLFSGQAVSISVCAAVVEEDEC